MFKLKQLILLVLEISIYFFALRILGDFLGSVIPVDKMSLPIQVIYELLKFVLGLGLFMICLICYSGTEHFIRIARFPYVNRKNCLSVAIFLLMQKLLLLVWTFFLVIGAAQALSAATQFIPYFIVAQILGLILWIALSGYLADKISKKFVSMTALYSIYDVQDTAIKSSSIA